MLVRPLKPQQFCAFALKVWFDLSAPSTSTFKITCSAKSIKTTSAEPLLTWIQAGLFGSRKIPHKHKENRLEKLHCRDKCMVIWCTFSFLACNNLVKQLPVADCWRAWIQMKAYLWVMASLCHETFWRLLDPRLHINSSRLHFWTMHGCYAHWAWERVLLCGHRGLAQLGSSWWRSCSRERKAWQKPFSAKRKWSWARRARSDLKDTGHSLWCKSRVIQSVQFQ